MTRSRRRDEVIREIRAAYSAFNRGDFDAAVTALDPKIEWREPLESRNPRKSLRLSVVVNPVEHENSSRQAAESSSI